MSIVSLQPKASVPFKFPLVCQLPAVSRDRGLSEAIATDFLFEAIQLVTCEITLSFLLAFFLTHHLISRFFFFSQAKFGQKIIKFKQQHPLPKKNYHLVTLHWVTQLWKPPFLGNNKQPLSFISRDDMKKTSGVHRIWVMWHYSGCLWGVWLFKIASIWARALHPSSAPTVLSSKSALQEINLMLCQDHKDQTSGEISLNHWNVISFI